MGNIVSSDVVPTPPTPAAAAVTAPQAGLPPVEASVAPSAPVAPSPVTTSTIEGIGSTQPAGFNADPFGPLPSIETTAPADTTPELPSITPEPPPPPAPEPPITPVKEETPTHATAAELLAKMPDVQTMMKDLEKSGCLLPELQVKAGRHIDTSPLAALQPKQLRDQSFFSSPSDEQPMKVLPEVQLASSKPVEKKELPELPMFVFVAVFALIQSIQGAAQLAHFIWVKYPEYEQMIVANVMTTTEVDSAMVRAIILGIMSAIGFMLGLLLLVKRSKNRSVDVYLVISMIVINFFVQNILVKNVMASGSPLMLPDILGEVISTFRK
jgi:hypothetical protein